MEVKFHNILNDDTLILIPNEKYYLLPNSGYIEIDNPNCDNYILNHVMKEITSPQEVEIYFKEASLELVLNENTYCLINLNGNISNDSIIIYQDFMQSLSAFNNKQSEIYSKDLFSVFNNDSDKYLELCSCNKHVDKVLEYTNNIQLIDDYIKYMPHIFYKPKIHLKQIEEIRPASLVTRIGNESIRHLASHSEHWKGINAGGLIPERLLARTLEDDYAIYENVAVKTLIDKVYALEKRNKEFLIDCIMNFSLSDSYSQGGESPKFFKTLNYLLKGYENNQLSTHEGIIEEKKKIIEEIISYINKCHGTELYRKLARAKEVRGKLKKTNIFMMDNYYKKAYALWQLLDKKENEEEIFEERRIKLEYLVFCEVLILFTLNYIGFVHKNKDKPILVKNLINEATFEFKDWVININSKRTKIFDGFIEIELYKKLTFEIKFDIALPNTEIYQEYNIQKVDNTLVCSKKLTDDEIRNLRKKIVPLVENNKDSKYLKNWESKFYQTLFDEMKRINIKTTKILMMPWKYGVPDDYAMASKLIQKFVSIMPAGFDEYYILNITRPNELKNIKDEELLKSLLNYELRNLDSELTKTLGIIPISSNDINSFRRFTKIFMKNMILVDTEHKYCPQCGEKLIGDDNNGYQCYNCNLTIRVTKCPTCNKKYLNTVYDFPTVVQLDTELMGMKLLLEENELGFKNITPMINKETVCPYCNSSKISLDFSNSIKYDCFLEDPNFQNYIDKNADPIVFRKEVSKPKTVITETPKPAVAKVTKPLDEQTSTNRLQSNRNTDGQQKVISLNKPSKQKPILIKRKYTPKFPIFERINSSLPDGSLLFRCTLCGKVFNEKATKTILKHLNKDHNFETNSGTFLIAKNGIYRCAKCSKQLNNLTNGEVCRHLNQDCFGRRS